MKAKWITLIALLVLMGTMAAGLPGLLSRLLMNFSMASGS